VGSSAAHKTLRSSSTVPRKYPGAAQSRRKFLRFFPGGFYDETYLAWERDYKWTAHERWEERLGRDIFRDLLRRERFREIADESVRIESRTNLLFSFEKMAVRDAVRSPRGARSFALGLYDFLYGLGSERQRFESWCGVLAALPRKQTRVLTWPVATVFGFLARPERHIFLKPNVTRRAAEFYGFNFEYQSRPEWPTYASMLKFANAARTDLLDLHPRDLIDIQSFLWVQGSDEYD
jgi:hypothetical protein